MPIELPFMRSQLYAPGNNPRILEKAHLSGADSVIYDLEDTVPPAEKARARAMVAEAVRALAGKPGPVLTVRINNPETGLAEDDINAVVQPGLSALRIPKVEDVETIGLVSGWLEQAEASAGLTAGSVALIPIIESALGVFRAYEIASASPRILAIGYGVADLTADLNLIPSPEGLETLYIRSHIVLASRIAGIRPPMDSVYVQLDDLEGLEQTTRQGRALGFFGRSALHPRQVPVINAVYTPAKSEVDHAREIVAAAEAAEARGSGALRIGDGEFIDVAIVRRAHAILRLAERIG